MACLEETAAMPWLMLVILFAEVSVSNPVHSILTPPSDVTGKVGGTAEFTCEVELQNNPVLTWEFNDDVIYYLQFDHENYPKGSSKYSVTRNGRNFVLKINDLQYDDGGTYTCQLLDEIVDANLIVIGTPKLFIPTLHPEEGYTTNYTCKAKFTGPKKADILADHYPHLEMFLDGEQLYGAVKDTHGVEGTTNYYELTQVQNMVLQTSMQGKSLRCDIKTSSPELHESITINVEVLYSVRDVRYTPNKTQYEVGSVITCAADGNPQPTFLWDFLWDDSKNPGNLIKGPSLRISEQMIQSKTWRCTATNTVNGQLHQESVLAEINVVLPYKLKGDGGSQSESGNDSWKIAVGVAIPVCLVVIAGIAAFYFYFYKRPKKQYNPVAATEEDGSRTKDEAEAANTPEKTNEPSMNQDESTKRQEMAKSHEKLKIMIGRFQREDLTDEVVEKEMLDILKNQENLDEDPLITLLPELEKEPSLAQNQTRLLKLLKILIPTDRPTDTRSRCMRVLLTMTREWGSCQGEEKNTTPLQWDAEFMEVWKLLIQYGADPVWLPTDPSQGSSLQELVKMVKHAIANKETDLLELLGDVFEIMDSTLPTNNIRHELVNVMSSLNSDDKHSLFKLLQCLKTTSNVNIQDDQNNTALHLLMHHAKNWSSEPKLFLDAVKCLESPKNENVSNNDGSTPLSIFTESASAWVSHPETFLKVVDKIATVHNVTYRDAQGRTALEIFSKSGETWKDCPETFLDVFKCLKSQISIMKDDSGKDLKTVLSSFNSWMNDLAYQPLAFLEVAKILCDTDTRDEQNKYGNTMLHIYCPRAKECANQPKAFLRIVACLKSPNNIDIMNASRETPLHIFISEAIGWEDNSEIFLDVVKCLKSPSNIDDKNNKSYTALHDKNNDGNTVLHIFISSRGRWEDSPAGFLEIVKCLVSPTNINMQNKKGETALHRFAGCKTEWASFKETSEIIKLLVSPQNIAIKNNIGKNAVDLFKDNWGDRAEPFLELATGQAV